MNCRTNLHESSAPSARSALSGFEFHLLAFSASPRLCGEKATRGAATIQLLVILVPVLFGLIGFAVDLGMIYSMKGELKAGAAAMALAGAQQLIGTDSSTTAAATAMSVTSNNYYFQRFPIGQGSGTRISTISDPVYYATAADAIANGVGGAAGAQARYVRVSVTGQMPPLFWGFLPLLTSTRNITVAATAVAGVSAPLCLACGIEPIAVAALNQSDTTDFGFTQNIEYSLSYLCTGGTPPPVLAGASQTIYYVLLNRFDPSATVFPDEGSQAFQYAAGGLPGTISNSACPAGQSCACFRVNNTESLWTDATVNTCGTVASLVTSTLCGLDARFESSPANACSNIQAVDTLSTIYTPDTDVNPYGTYNSYTGNGRRVVTIPIVDMLSSSGTMTVLGFRQFLLIPQQTPPPYIDPSNSYGSFAALYIGSVVPVPQGRFDGCQQTAGPGKVVLHQ